LISDTVHEKKLELAGENGIKTVYDLQSYWTSMAAILDSLGFTFLIDRMTEVLTPDIYIELTGINQARSWLSISGGGGALQK
jgi:hypothetical protein